MAGHAVDLNDLWWSLIGLFFLAAPFAVAALTGLALPAGTVLLARQDRWLSSETKVALLLGLLALTAALAVALSGRTFFTDREVAQNPALAALASETPLDPWTTRIGTALILLLVLSEVAGWLLGRRTMPGPARMLWLSALLFDFAVMVLAGVAGTFGNFEPRLLYMPLVLTGLAVLATVWPMTPLQALRGSLWLVMVGSLIAGAVAPHLALERDYTSLLPGLSWRLIGLSEHANGLGQLAAIALAIELTPLIVAKPRWWVLGPVLAALVLAQSKTAWAEALIAVGIAGLLRLRDALSGADLWRGRIGLLALGAFAGALLLTGLGVLLGSTRVLAWIDDFGLTTFTGRTSIWSLTWAEFERSPWFGFGPALWDMQYRYERGMMHVGQAHNQYIHTLGQAGLVGAFSLLLYLGLLLRLSWRALAHGYALPLMVCLMVLLRGLTETPLAMTSITGSNALMHMLAFWLAANGAYLCEPAVEEDQPACDDLQPAAGQTGAYP